MPGMAADTNSQSSAELQKFLDEHVYTMKDILKHEKIYGAGFQSTGGLDITKEFVDRLNLKENQKVLDIGCGVGGSAFYMAKNFGVTVLGIDLSTNMVNIAMERIAKEADLKNRVDVKVMDATTDNFEANFFDVIYSRDAILHIEKKEELFKLCLKWLKPGGQLLISDYCCGTNVADDDGLLKYYLERWKYFYIDSASYGKLLERAGFIDVDIEDRTEQFSQMLCRKKSKMEHDREKNLKTFSQANYDYVMVWSQENLQLGQDGLQTWNIFYARKPFIK